jgi:hypothetical protein
LPDVRAVGRSSTGWPNDGLLTHSPCSRHELSADGHDDPPRLFAGHRAILADAGLQAMGLHKQHAMTTLLHSYEFGLPPPHVI